MNSSYRDISIGLLALLAAIALATGAAACGGGDDGGDQASGQVGGEVREAPDDPNGQAGPEEEIRSQYEEFVEALYEGDLATVCDHVADGALREIAGDKGCEAWLQEQTQSRQLSDERPFVVSVDVSGKRATVRAKTRSSKVYAVPLVRTDAGWKMAGVGQPES